jgi:hypothetical protein
MSNVYLLSTDADTASNIRDSFALLGAVGVHSCAWVIPWSYSFASLVARIRSLLPCYHKRIVIAEIAGDYVAI